MICTQTLHPLSRRRERGANPPRVSVIMNVLNGEAFLREAIDSVLVQSFRDWELIVWDDRSQDGSAAVAASYDDPRIRCVCADAPVPLGRARELAIREATGQWLAFLDQDDIWEPDKLARQVALADRFEGRGVGIIYGRTLLFDERGNLRDYDHRHEFEPLPQGDIFARLFEESCFIAMSSAMLRREAVVALGGIPERVEVTPDYFLFAGVARNWRARAAQEVVCRYRVHGDNMSRAACGRMHREVLWLLDRWSDHLNERLLARRRRIHQTLIALEALRRPRRISEGLVRLMMRGSLPFLLTRPFARARRAVARRLRRPNWRKDLRYECGGPVAVHRPADAGADAVDLSVVIVTHNNEKVIGDCLDSLTADARALRLEVIVVDCASRDGTVALIRDRYPQVELIASRENLGFSAGNNAALRRARGRHVCLLNPDTIVRPGALAAMLDVLRDPGVGMVGPTLRLADGAIQCECARPLPRLSNLWSWILMLDKIKWRMRFGRRSSTSGDHPPRGSLFDRWSLLNWDRSRACDVESLCGACMMFRRDVLDTIGGLDETMPMFLDDIDYCRRVLDAGWRIRFEPAAEVTHLWKQSSGQFRREGDFYAMGCHSVWLYLRKHYGACYGAAFAGMAMAASPVRVAVCGTLVLLTRGEMRAFVRRQMHMAAGLVRWSWRWSKRPARFGFACESGASGVETREFDPVQDGFGIAGTREG